MEYIDGFVAVVPITNRAQYIEHARKAALLFKAYGALRLVECWGDDVPEEEQGLSLRKAVHCRADEQVVFSWVVWPSREVRDRGMAGVMQDPRMAENPMPFDAQRLLYGGFRVVVDA